MEEILEILQILEIRLPTPVEDCLAEILLIQERILEDYSEETLEIPEILEDYLETTPKMQHNLLVEDYSEVSQRLVDFLEPATPIQATQIHLGDSSETLQTQETLCSLETQALPTLVVYLAQTTQTVTSSTNNSNSNNNLSNNN